MVVKLASIFLKYTVARQIRMTNGEEFLSKERKDWFTDSKIIPEYPRHFSLSSMGKRSVSIEHWTIPVRW